jgi:hypothetical protein
MSKLAHMCTTCGHQETHHEKAVSPKAHVGCPCCRAAKFAPDPEPTLLPTIAYPSREPEPLYEPGSVRNRGEHLCGCEACRAAYVEHTAG